MIKKILSLFIVTFSLSSFSQVLVNEVMSSNTNVYPDFQVQYNDWVELYNTSSNPINLSGYGLSDDSNAPFKWVFPTVLIPAKSHVLVFCSSKNVEINGELHSNFKISSDETIYLSAPSGVLLDKVEPDVITTNQSWGRITDGLNSWSIFTTSSPKASNSIGVMASNLISKPSTSQKSGFYTQTISVSVTCPDAGSSIVYSLDGNDPKLSYTAPLSITSSKVLKTACAKTNDTSGVKTDSYFIGANHDIPVVSLSFRPDDFFGVDSGIYVLGSTYEFANPNLGANFWEKWQRKVHFEYFVNKEEVIEQDVGAEIHGGWSRAQPMKSLRLLADKEYGSKSMDYPFFTEKPYLESFTELVLRNGGNDFNNTMWVDALNHRSIAKVSDVDRQAYQPVAVYFNGVYMGLHNMRERVGTAYIAQNHNIDEKSINFLELNGGVYLATANLPVTNTELEGQIKEGSNASWLLLYDSLTKTPMSKQLYDWVETQWDLEQLVDYFAAQTYHINWDWPHNNIRFWQSDEVDSKWRYCYYDTEFGMGINGSTTAVTYNELNRVINDNRNVHSIMFKKLLEYPEFKNKFINRMCDFMNTIYLPSEYKGLAQQLDAVIKNEIVLHQAKYGNKAGRDNRVAGVYAFIDARPNNFKNHITSVFGNTNTTITLNVVPSNAGKIKINTVVPSIYPWNGTYYNGVPVEIVAIPNEGFSFDSWDLNAILLSDKLSDTVTTNSTANTITANFKVTSDSYKLVLSEVNYHDLASSNEVGDWIEIYNAGNKAVDLSSWVFKDVSPYNEFIIPELTTLGVGQYLIIAKNVATFKAKNPSLTNVIGGFNFGLSKSHDVVNIYDQLKQSKIQFAYTDDTLSLADGKGATLELKNTSLDYKKMMNWQAKCIGGSPGVNAKDCNCQFDVNIGEDTLICKSKINVDLNPNLSATGKNFFWYKDGDLISIESHYVATELNKFNLVVQSGTCIKDASVKLFGPTNPKLGEDFGLCNPSSVLLTSGLNFKVDSYQWLKNNNLVSSQSSLMVNQPATYILKMIAADCPIMSDTVVVYSNGPLVQNELFCEEDSTKTISTSGSGNYEWYSTKIGGTSIGSGLSLSVHELISDTTFYVQDNTAQNYVLGLSTSTINSSSADVGSNGMLFTINEQITLDAVSVRRAFSQGSVTMVIRVLNNKGIVVNQKSFNLTSNTNLTKLALGFVLAPGDYTIDAVGTTTSMGGVNARMRYETQALSFPYSVQNVMSIKGTSIGGVDRYNFFYNWEITTNASSCARTPLYLTKEDCIPTALEDKKEVKNMFAYPNPVSDVLMFSDKVIIAKVVDMHGRLVLTTQNSSVNLSHLDAGLYIVELYNSIGQKEIEKLEVFR